MPLFSAQKEIGSQNFAQGIPCVSKRSVSFPAHSTLLVAQMRFESDNENVLRESEESMERKTGTRYKRADLISSPTSWSIIGCTCVATSVEKSNLLKAETLTCRKAKAELRCRNLKSNAHVIGITKNRGET